MTSNKELEQTLRATFTSRAEEVTSGPTWEGADTASADGRHDRVATDHARRSPTMPKWRAPLLAAVAVLVVAATTSAIVTGGFRGGNDTAAPKSDLPAMAVPISCPPAAPGDDCAASNFVAMTFVDGDPPNAGLRWVLSLDGWRAASYETHSDGSPLGYVTFAGAIIEGRRFLWGAAGPDVAQVQIQALMPPAPGDSGSMFSPASPSWTFDSDNGDTLAPTDADRTVWTDLGDKWHGFAVEIPLDTERVNITARAAGGAIAQQRTFTIAVGQGGASDISPVEPAPGSPATDAITPGFGSETNRSGGRVTFAIAIQNITDARFTLSGPVELIDTSGRRLAGSTGQLAAGWGYQLGSALPPAITTIEPRQQAQIILTADLDCAAPDSQTLWTENSPTVVIHLNEFAKPWTKSLATLMTDGYDARICD